MLAYNTPNFPLHLPSRLKRANSLWSRPFDFSSLAFLRLILDSEYRAEFSCKILGLNYAKFESYELYLKSNRRSLILWGDHMNGSCERITRASRGNRIKIFSWFSDCSSPVQSETFGAHWLVPTTRCRLNGLNKLKMYQHIWYMLGHH